MNNQQRGFTFVVLLIATLTIVASIIQSIVLGLVSIGITLVLMQSKDKKALENYASIGDLMDFGSMVKIMLVLLSIVVIFASL